MTPAWKRIRNALPFAVAILAISIAGEGRLDVMALALAAFAALGQWIVHPLLARKTGVAGVAMDIAICLLGLAIAGALAGTLLAAPGWGTILGLRAAIALPLSSGIGFLAVSMAIATTILLARR